MRLLFLQVLAICSLVAGAVLHRANHVVHERRADAEPVTSTKTRRLEAHRNLTIRIGLAQQNLDELEETLLSVSHPESAKYAQHWSPERVAEYFAPSEATVSAVKAWLIDTGFCHDRLLVAPSKGWIHFRANASDAEYLLKTEFHVYTHPSGREQISYNSYAVPEVISEHIDLIRVSIDSVVHHGHDSPAPLKRSNIKPGEPPLLSRRMAAIVPTLDNCDQYITPECLRALYSIDYTPEVPQLNSFGIVEITPQAYLGSDLDKFFSEFSESQVKTRPVLVSIDGGVVQQQNQSAKLNGESDLDLEYAMALTDPTPVTLLQTGDLIKEGTFNNWLDAVDGSYCKFEGGDDPNVDQICPDRQPGGFDHLESCGIIAPPKVISVSYNVDEDRLSVAYVMRQCYEYGKLGLMGTTVLYATGDSGVAGTYGCLPDSDGHEGIKFNPSFPVSCPYVTAVGATQMNANSTVHEPESACEVANYNGDGFTYSGGGFSNVFRMPSYQEDAVLRYLMEHPPPYSARQYNNSRKVRAYPDISANGANYIIARDGKFALTYGTSASTPVVGAIVALINDARLSRSKRPVGFLNPVIYHPLFSDAFHDITTGRNPGCGTPGFVAAKGWDPVTGVGTPNMKNLLEMLLILP